MRRSATTSRCCGAARGSAGGKVGAVSTREMAAHDDWRRGRPPMPRRAATAPKSGVSLEIAGLFAENDEGRERRRPGSISRCRPVRSSASPACPATAKASLWRRCPASGRSRLGQSSSRDQNFEPTRDHFDRFKVFGLPEEPLKNATVPHDVGGREHGVPPIRQSADDASRLLAVARADARQRARAHQPLQRQDAVDRDANSRLSRAATCNAPCWRASCPATSTCSSSPTPASASTSPRSPTFGRRSWSSATAAPRCSLVSEDLDEILELSDRIAVMSGGKINYVSPVSKTDRHTIGQHMAGH